MSVEFIGVSFPENTQWHEDEVQDRELILVLLGHVVGLITFIVIPIQTPVGLLVQFVV
jgi:hypothetical protein|tara:strand:- start:41 stop:214 length:174 start_codon:yes stop_codon:yes gene_type:complete